MVGFGTSSINWNRVTCGNACARLQLHPHVRVIRTLSAAMSPNYLHVSHSRYSFISAQKERVPHSLTPLTSIEAIAFHNSAFDRMEVVKEGTVFTA